MNLETDFFGFTIEAGDRVIFPNRQEFMEGTAEKFRQGRLGISGNFRIQVFVRNELGYAKWKDIEHLVNVTKVNKMKGKI